MVVGIRVYKPVPFIVALSLLILIVLSACGGSGVSGKDQGGDNSGGETANSGIIVETGDPENPYMTIGGNGNIVSFQVNPITEQPTGISIITSGGDEGYLAIDEASGMPDYWVSSGNIVIFSNVRSNQGLIDVSFIYQDGTTITIEDINYEDWVTTENAGLSMTSSSMMLSNTSDGSINRKKFTSFLSALDATISVTACIGGAILTGGSAFAGVTFPPAGVPLFATTAAATAAACSASFVKFMALDSKNAEIAGLNDVLGVPGVAESVAECLTKPGVLMCLKTSADVVGFVASGLVQGVMATYIRLRDGRARANNRWAYCCNGPTQIKRRTSSSWQAGVDPLFLDAAPYKFHFYFNDFTSPVIQYSDDVLSVASHEFRDEGNYLIDVKVFDDTNKSAISNKFPVEVYGDLNVSCGSTSRVQAKKNEIFDLSFDISGGKRPFTYEVKSKNMQPQKGKSVKRVVSEKIAFSESGLHFVYVAVRDGDNELSECVSTVDIAETDKDGDGYDDSFMGGTDCDDNDANVFPGATEICDGIDNNCNAQIDEGFDNDGDSHTICMGDCNDSDSSIHPGAPEIRNDGIDQNCDGVDSTNEYVVWYMDNVRCWGAPRVYATSRDSFIREEDTCNIPGGGTNCDIKVEKIELRGGFNTLEAAQRWFCPKITGRINHYWCNHRGPRVIANGIKYTSQIPCDLTDVPWVPEE